MLCVAFCLSSERILKGCVVDIVDVFDSVWHRARLETRGYGKFQALFRQCHLSFCYNLISAAKSPVPRRRGVEIPDNIDEALATIPGRRRGQRSKSPSPPAPAPQTVEAPKSQQPSQPRKRAAVSIDIDDNDIDAAFAAIPSRKRGQRARSPSPAPQANVEAKSREPAQPRKRARVAIDMDGDIDQAFDQIPSRKQRLAESQAQEAREKSQADIDADIDAALAAVPTRRGRKGQAKSRSPTPPPAIVKTNASPAVTRSSPRRPQKRDMFSPSGTKPPGPTAGADPAEAGPSAPIKKEVVTPAKPRTEKTQVGILSITLSSIYSKVINWLATFSFDLLY